MKGSILVRLGLGIVLAAAVSTNCLAGSAASPFKRSPKSDEESKRVELVAQLERSVVVVLVEGREIQHEQKTLALLPSASLGTGVVLSADGLVLTAAHVVAGADRIRVKPQGGEPLAARVVFADEDADIALLRLETASASLVPAKLGDSSRVRKGETTYVIGNPVGIEFSLSTGVVSGRHPIGHVFGGSVEAEVIQTDAAINSGNSGGPIFNSRGEVIAIAQGILSKGGGSEGLGFGLSINVVKKILGSDRAFGSASREYRSTRAGRQRSISPRRVVCSSRLSRPAGRRLRREFAEARSRSRSDVSTPLGRGRHPES